jgi:hypothetical protein
MSKKLTRQILAPFLALIGIAGAVILLREHSISEWVFLALFSVSCLVGLFVGFIDRIEVLNLTDLKITLRDIKEAEREVIATKKEVQELAIRTALLVVLSRKGALYYNGAGPDAINEQIQAIINVAGVEENDPILDKIRDAGCALEVGVA